MSELMQEARDLIAFYDEHGWNWESALAFTMCKDLFGSRMRVHPIEGYRCYPYPKEEKYANHIRTKKDSSVSDRV